MTSDPDSSYLLPNLDFDLLPRCTGKHLDSLTCSSPHHYTMADLYTTVMGYTQLLLTLMCLISGLASMPFINLCSGGGSFAGTMVLSAGVGLLLNSYFRRDFPLHEPPPKETHKLRTNGEKSVTISSPWSFRSSSAPSLSSSSKSRSPTVATLFRLASNRNSFKVRIQSCHRKCQAVVWGAQPSNLSPLRPSMQKPAVSQSATRCK